MTDSRQSEQNLRALGAVLREERGHYEILLKLAKHQGVMMTSHDLQGLDESAAAISKGLAVADTVRIRRERLAGELMDQSTEPGQATGLSTWLTNQPREIQEILTEPVQSVRRVAGELARTNEMNRRLANFCLDLVEEEAAVLRRCLLEDPAGRYDKGAKHTQNEQGGVLSKQA